MPAAPLSLACTAPEEAIQVLSGPRTSGRQSAGRQTADRRTSGH